MGPILSSLVNLQTIEVEVRKAKDKLNSGQRTILKQEQNIKQLESSLNAKREEIKMTRMHYDKMDMDLKGREAEVAKLRVSLNSAKTNKEYSAVLTQINTTKADTSKLEDQMLGLINQIEDDQKLCKEIESRIQTAHEQLNEVRQEIQSRQKGLKEKLDELQARHDEAVAAVPDELRLHFQRLADRFDGEVLAFIENSDSKRNEQTCGGCFMKVPLEAVNALMTKDEVLYCPSCGRILMIEPNSSR